MRYVLVLLSFLLSPALSHASDLMHDLFGCTSNKRCVIKHSEGGDTRDFAIAADEARILGTEIIIDGPCESACVILASELRKQVCLTSRARMRVHLGISGRLYDRNGTELDLVMSRALSYDMPKGYTVHFRVFVPDYGKDINEWAARGHKLNPEPAIFTTMTRKEATRFWRWC